MGWGSSGEVTVVDITPTPWVPSVALDRGQRKGIETRRGLCFVLVLFIAGREGWGGSCEGE